MSPRPGADAVRVELPPDGCWVALSCELRVRAAAPFRLSTEAPTLRTPSSVEVLSIAGTPLLSAPAGPDAWIVRVIAFEPGDVAMPAMRVEVLDAGGRRSTIDTPGQTIAVHGRSIAAASPLADLEALAPTAAAVLMSVAVGLSAVIMVAAAASLIVVRRHRLAAWAAARVAVMRARRRATRLLRCAASDTEANSVYDRIVQALRVALTPGFGSAIVSLTSAELLALAARSPMDDAQRQALAALLATSDSVRFGGHVPSPAQAAADLARARAVVRSRRFVQQSLRLPAVR